MEVVIGSRRLQGRLQVAVSSIPHCVSRRERHACTRVTTRLQTFPSRPDSKHKKHSQKCHKQRQEPQVPGPSDVSVFYAITVSNFLQFLTFVGAGCWPWFVNFFLGVRFLLKPSLPLAADARALIGRWGCSLSTQRSAALSNRPLSQLCILWGSLALVFSAAMLPGISQEPSKLKFYAFSGGVPGVCHPGLRCMRFRSSNFNSAQRCCQDLGSPCCWQ